MDPLDEKIDNARTARSKSRIEDAWEIYQDIVTHCRRDGLKSKLIVGLNGLAQIERDRGNPERSLSYYLEAASLACDLDEALVFAHTIRHVADVYQRVGDLDSAESHYQEALAIYRADSRTSALDLANAIRPMALLMEQLFRISDAKCLWEEAERLYTSAAISEGIAECREAIERCS